MDKLIYIMTQEAIEVFQASRNPSEGVKKLYYDCNISGKVQDGESMVRRSWRRHIGVPNPHKRSEPFLVKLLETFHLFNAFSLAHHPNYAHWGLQHKRIHCLML